MLLVQYLKSAAVVGVVVDDVDNDDVAVVYFTKSGSCERLKQGKEKGGAGGLFSGRA